MTHVGGRTRLGGAAALAGPMRPPPVQALAARQVVVRRVATARLPTDAGLFRALGYREVVSGHEHVALAHGTPAGQGGLVHVHPECLMGDALGSGRCDCGERLRESMRRIVAEGAGLVVYLRGHEGRRIALIDRIRTYALQDTLDTVDADLALGHLFDARDFAAAAAILADLTMESVRLLSNNPKEADALEQAGAVVDGLEPLAVEARPTENEFTGWTRS